MKLMDGNQSQMVYVICLVLIKPLLRIVWLNIIQMLYLDYENKENMSDGNYVFERWVGTRGPGVRVHMLVRWWNW